MSEPVMANGTGGRVAEAPAKINLFLLVGEQRVDGYHPLYSLMEKMSLSDRVSIRRTGRPGVRILGTDIPAPGNTVFRAAMLLEEETGIELDVEIRLDKEIPEAAGLAGGSSDAAAVLNLLDNMFQLDIPPARMGEIALGIGADVPFFLQPGPMVAEGAGELLGRASALPGYHAVIVKPEAGLSTADVYELYDRIAPEQAGSFLEHRQSHQELLAGGDGSIGSLARLLHNDLELPAMQLCDEILPVKEELLALGAAGALMSGSGPSVFALFSEEMAANAAYGKLSESYRNTWLTHPIR